jgi:LysM repeat protein
MKVHTVQAGETLAAIARKYGVRLNSLLSANPGIEPRHMRVGQTLNIPAR